MPLAGFEPAVPVSERPQTHALDRAVTGTGVWTVDKVRGGKCWPLGPKRLVTTVDGNGWPVSRCVWNDCCVFIERLSVLCDFRHSRAVSADVNWIPPVQSHTFFWWVSRCGLRTDGRTRRSQLSLPTFAFWTRPNVHLLTEWACVCFVWSSE